MKEIIKKILFIGLYPNKMHLYSNVFFQNLVWSIADLGVECTVIAPLSITQYGRKIKKLPNEYLEITKKGNKIRVIEPKYLSYSSKRIGFYNTVYLTEGSFYQSVIKTVKKYNLEFDAVYGHFILRGGLTAVKIGKKYKKPSYFAYGECNLFTEVTSVYKKLNKNNIGLVNGVISVSKKNTNELLKTGIIEAEKIGLFPNATNLDTFHPKRKDECRQLLGLSKEDFILGFLGGFIERKGDKRLLKAAEGLSDVKLAFAGAGTTPPEGGNVVFCQSLPHEKVPEFLNAIDVFVLPTLNEGCCNSIIEAMACGVPIISSNLSFNDEILDETNSIKINPNSIEEIRKAIILLRDDIKLRKRLAAGAYQAALKLSIEDRAKHILKFMNEKAYVKGNK